ncbi:unnamed protein product (macronuclear) [Paramecium tetraurelia]|uniref:LITAF domain-containing protein n=1 Tax=Paramecium tetraurelia TaxID=5888 RepID=A0DVI5_PARTE|nr:uncharacterized protein GSPATT00020705001 [Paramecium tetraurelia]CAK87052.1 unnamed protein product [Paramecium tetraurelia]|eukprot:XP_001454449.1 hypothetical protein (macronuclear) [Paramecium tetraurelia strain d4-2]
MKTHTKSQLYQEENIPIKIQQQEQIQAPEQKQENNRITASIPVYEKTRLPESRIYMNKSKIPQFQEVQIHWSQRAPYQQIVAQQIVSEVRQSAVEQINNQQIAQPISRPYQPGSGFPTRQNLPQIPKMKHSQYLQCKWCNQEVHSQVEYRIGLSQLLLCLLLSPAFGIELIYLHRRIKTVITSALIVGAKQEQQN